MRQINCQVNPSLRLCLCYSLLLLFVTYAIWQCQVADYYKILLNLVGLGYSVYLIQRYALLIKPSSIVHLGYDQQAWNLVNRRGDNATVDLLAGSYVSRYFIQLNFKDNMHQKRHVVLLMPDSIGVDNFRRLRVLLQMVVS